MISIKDILLCVVILFALAVPAAAQDGQVEEPVKKEKKNTSVLKAKIEELNSYIQQLRKDSAQLAEDKEREIQAVKDTEREKNSKLRDELNKKNEQIAAMQTELNNLQIFKVKYLEQSADGIDENFIFKKFSQIDSLELESTCKILSDYAASSSKISAASRRLSDFKRDYLSYCEGRNAVNSPYNAAEVKRLFSVVSSLADRASNTDNKDELDTLAWQLNNYKSILGNFQKLITDVVDRRIELNPTNTWGAVKVELDMLIKQKYSAIKDIPYLERKFQQYYEALEKDCFGDNPARKEIIETKL